LLLEGAHNWDPLLYIHLVQDYGIEVDVAQHLANTYGDRSFVVARMCKMTGKRWPIVGHRLHEEFPYLEAVTFSRKISIKFYIYRKFVTLLKNMQLQL
jgi:glycerol-3-phosphate dehydrogenase